MISAWQPGATRVTMLAGRLLPFLALLPLAACAPLRVINAVSPSSHYTLERDVAYGDGPRQTLDVYLPRAPRAHTPLVVFFYGGGWRSGAKEKYEFAASSLTQAGFVVMIPDYRLFPEVAFPAFVDDGAEALAFAARNAQRYGASEKAVYLMGHSAGAHIAALLALDARYRAGVDSAAPPLAGWLGLSGPYDFLPIESGYLLEVFPEATRADSQPIAFVSADAPPTLLVHGGDDDVVKAGNSERLANALREHHVPVTLKVYPGLGHARIAAELAPPLNFIGSVLEDCVAFIEANERAAGR